MNIKSAVKSVVLRIFEMLFTFFVGKKQYIVKFSLRIIVLFRYLIKNYCTI